MKRVVDWKSAIGAVVATLALSTFGCGEGAETDGGPPSTLEVAVGEEGVSDIELPPEDARDLPLVDEGAFDPEEVVPTPYGPMARKCITKVAPGSIIGTDGAVTTATGARVLPIKCPLPARAPSAAPTSAAEGPETNGWVIARASHVPSWARAMTAQFLVPSSPVIGDDQTIFFFPGFENEERSAIVQSVLQWGPSAAGGGQHWSIASWMVGPRGTYVSPVLDAYRGDLIGAFIRGDNCSETGQCSWRVSTAVNGVSVSLYLARGDVPRMVWAIGGALEAYRMNMCRELPGNGGRVSFGRIKVYDRTLTEWGMSWTQWNYHPVPDCGYSSSASSGRSSFVNINYGTRAP